MGKKKLIRGAGTGLLALICFAWILPVYCGALQFVQEPYVH